MAIALPKSVTRRPVKRVSRKKWTGTTPRPAPYSLLDRTKPRADGNRSYTTPRRAVKRLNRQAAAGRRDRQAYRQGKPVKTGGGNLQVRLAGGRGVTLTPAQYRSRLAHAQLDVASRANLLRRNPELRNDALRRARPNTLKVAGLNLGITPESVVRTIAKTPVPELIRGPGQLLKIGVTRGGRDAVALPANVVVGAYHTGAALEKAIPVPGLKKSDTREVKALWNEFKKSDPIALAAQGKFKQAAIAGGQHPLATSLELVGGVGSADRLAGAVRHPGAAAARLVGGPEAAARAATRAVERRRRPVRRIPGTNLEERRQYAKGAGMSALQRRHDVRGLRKVNRLTTKARALEAQGGQTAKVERLRERAQNADPTRVPDRYVHGRVDALEAQTQSMRRPGRSATSKESTATLVKKHGRAMSMIAQRIVLPTRENMRKYAEQLDQVYTSGELDRHEVRQNRRNRNALVKALQDPKFDPAAVAEHGVAMAKVQAPLEDLLVKRNMFDSKAEAERARLKPYAIQHMGARYSEEHGLVRDVRHVGSKKTHEVPLTTEQIRQHMQHVNGLNPDETLFVSHARIGGGDGAFNISARRVQSISTKARTGEAVRKGTFDSHPARMVEHNVRLRGLADATQSFERFLSDFAVRGKNGKIHPFATKKDATDAAKKAILDEHGDEIPGAHKFVAIKASPWAGRKAQLQHALEHADHEGFTVDHGEQGVGGATLRHPVTEALSDALRGKGDNTGGWVLVPARAAARMDEHASVVAGSNPALRTITQGFRRTVLPLSTSWLTGNALEAGLRTAIAGAGPRSWVSYRRAYQELARQNPEKAAEFLHATPGGHYGGVGEQMVRTSARQFENTHLEPVAKAFAKLRNTPGPREVADAYVKFSDWMFGSLNATLEGQFTRTLAGKHLRQTGAIPRQAGKIRMTAKDREILTRAVEQASHGIRNTNDQAAMADFVRRAYGKYDGYGPGARKAIMNWTPFGAWTWNAAKFIVSVLPKDHPALTAMLAANHQLTEDWRKQHGLDEWSQSPLPGFLQGSIPLPGGQHLRVARYTPFGLAANPLDTVAANVLPQFSGTLATFRGEDWKGQKIKINGKDPDDLQKAFIAAREFAFSTVPVIGLALRTKGNIREKGVPGGLKKTYWPFNPVKPKQKAAGNEFENYKRKSGPDVSAEFDKFKAAN